MSKSKTTSLALAAVLFVASGQSFLSSSPVSAQLDLLQEIAAYSRQVNQVTQQFGDIVNRTIEYDNLAYQVIEGRMDGAAADRRARALSSELWALHAQGKGQLEALPDPPRSVEQRGLRARLENVRAMADTAEEMARGSISSGEELVQAAIGGDASVINRIEIRGIELMLAQLRQQSALIDTHIANDTTQGFDYYLTSAVKSETEALIVMLTSVVDQLKTGDSAHLTEAKPKVRAWIDKGLADIEAGRKATRDMLAHYRSASPGSDQERQMLAILVEILEGNAQESFEVEAQILREIAVLSENDYLLEAGELDAFTARLIGLEEKRAQLMLARQQRLASPQ